MVHEHFPIPRRTRRLSMRKAGVGAAAVVLLAVLMFFAVSSWSRQPAIAKPSVQPINFPHNVHVQTYKIDCQYCHSRRAALGIRRPALGRALHGLSQDHGRRQAGDQEAGRVRRQAASRSRGRACTSCRSSRTSRTRRTSAPRSRARPATAPVETMTTAARHHRPDPDQRSAEPRRTAAGAAAADHGLVRRLPSPAERDARHPGAARLRDVPPLSEPRRAREGDEPARLLQDRGDDRRDGRGGRLPAGDREDPAARRAQRAARPRRRVVVRHGVPRVSRPAAACWPAIARAGW